MASVAPIDISRLAPIQDSVKAMTGASASLADSPIAAAVASGVFVVFSK
jgi:hypothetical protein